MKIQTQTKAGGLNIQHNQTLVRMVEGDGWNHNQTQVRTVEGIWPNHNRTLVRTAS